MAYKLAVFFEIWGDFERLYCISIYYASALSLHMESTDSMIMHPLTGLYVVCICIYIIYILMYIHTCMVYQTMKYLHILGFDGHLQFQEKRVTE